jgi:predicted amidohydrolase
VVRIALVQQRASEDREANRRRGLEAVEAAAGGGAGVVCFAELAFDTFYPAERATCSRWPNRCPDRPWRPSPSLRGRWGS